jgi:hypothetical protein
VGNCGIEQPLERFQFGIVICPLCDHYFCHKDGIARSPALGGDHIPDFRCDIGAAKPRDGANAGRRGDVDFGQVAVDHVDADEQQPVFA